MCDVYVQCVCMWCVCARSPVTYMLLGCGVGGCKVGFYLYEYWLT